MNRMQIDVPQLMESMLDQIRPVLNDRSALIGIANGGYGLLKFFEQKLPAVKYVGSVDIGLHRDDYSVRGFSKGNRNTDIPFNIDGKDVILVDDVVQSGRTVRAAINELFDFGRPRSIKLAVLVDRGGRELPIAPDYLGTFLEVEVEQEVVIVDDGNNRLSIQVKRSVG